MSGWCSNLIGIWKNAFETSKVETCVFWDKAAKSSRGATKDVACLIVALFKSLPSKRMQWSPFFFFVTNRLLTNKEGSGHSLIMLNSTFDLKLFVLVLSLHEVKDNIFEF